MTEKKPVSAHAFLNGFSPAARKRIRTRARHMLATAETAAPEPHLPDLSPEQLERIKADALREIEEIDNLRDLRQRLEVTQQSIAAILELEQNNVSRIERRDDLLISTLRKYVEAVGGTLDVVVSVNGRKLKLASLSSASGVAGAPPRTMKGRGAKKGLTGTRSP